MRGKIASVMLRSPDFASYEMTFPSPPLATLSLHDSFPTQSSCPSKICNSSIVLTEPRHFSSLDFLRRVQLCSHASPSVFVFISSVTVELHG